MITTAIFYFIYMLASVLVAVLPESEGFSASTQSSLQSIFAYAEPFSFIIDFGQVFWVFSAVFVFWSGFGIWYSINWVLRKIPGVQ